MADQASSRQKLNVGIIVLVAVIVLGGGAFRFFSPSSPLRPQASELGVDTFSAPQQVTFRDGQVTDIKNKTITVKEQTGTFSFTLDDTTIIRGLNKDNQFEIIDQNKLQVGDFITAYYDLTGSTQNVTRVDIIQAK